MIKATLYKTDGTLEAVSIRTKSRLKTLQTMVGGLIQVIQIVNIRAHLRGDYSGGNDLVINEEALLLDLPINPFSNLVGKNSIWEAQEFRGNLVLIEGLLP